MYVLVTDGGSCATHTLLKWLAELYVVVSEIEPRLDVVPLLEFAGWDAGAVAALPDVADVDDQVAADGAAHQAMHSNTVVDAAAGIGAVKVVAAAADRLASTAPAEHEQTGSSASAAAKASASVETAAAAAHLGPPALLGPSRAAVAAAALSEADQGELLAFTHVAVGGTFDRLHAGHRLLLAATALVATELVYVGVTADELLAKKSRREWLQPYEDRSNAALAFIRAVRPSLSVSAGALCDPAEPTQAELDPEMQALVVSHETLPGGEAINVGRSKRGFETLKLVVVGVVGQRADGSKLSSTVLREQDAIGGSG